jgi:putative integral membrane protein (TIGR02587 family)
MARPERDRGGARRDRGGRERRDGAPDDDRRESVGATARAHLRAIAGGLLVGLPLLWTMEVWEDGAVLDPAKLLVLLAIGFGVVVGFNALAGFRRDRTWIELLVDSVQALGLSALVAALALAVLGRLDLSLGLQTIAGRVAIEAIPVAFGMSLAATVMGQQDGDAGGPADEGDGGVRADDESSDGPVHRLVVAGAGALYFALNIAPTDEVRLLAAASSPPQLLVAVAVSLAVGLAIVFHAEFRGGLRGASWREVGPLGTPLGETAVVYVLALLVSLVLLWAFGSTDGATPSAVLAQVVMLGIVAAFGAAAGRLLLGSGPEPGDAEGAGGAQRAGAS